MQELLAYLASPRREPVKETGPASAPGKSALEQGKVNETFKVYVRIRPMLKREAKAASVDCVQVADVDFPRDPPPQRITAWDPRLNEAAKETFTNHYQRGEFVFDRVFYPGLQSEVFNTVAKSLVSSFLEGTNATIFAYGQTGTGKTYTMEGPGGDGLISQCVCKALNELPASATLYYQYVQLYDASFTDLLDPREKKLSIVEGAKFMYVRGARVVKAKSAGDMLQEVERGASFRTSGKTNMNDASSRSHAILLVMASEDDPNADGVPESGTALYLVDLAGSERVKRSGAQGQTFSEAVSINSALSALGRVVTSLVEFDGHRASHISYKDNPLTNLLKSGLGGASKTALVACITAANDSLDESLNTLRFAAQASHIKNRVALKEKRDQKSADEEAIADAGNSLRLSAGKGVVPLPSGPVEVIGSWEDNGELDKTVILLSDLNQDPAELQPLIGALAGKCRVLAPRLPGTAEKHLDKDVATLLELLDWLGAAAPVVYGRDWGVPRALRFKIAHPSRAAAVVLENADGKINEKEYKARMKKDPGYVMKAMGTTPGFLWFWDGVFPSDVSGAKVGNNMKGFKGKAVLLWPLCTKGRHDPSGKSTNGKFGETLAKPLKTKMIDSYLMTEADIAAKIMACFPSSDAG